MDKKDIVVVVPIYLSTLTPEEEVSLKQCLTILAEYRIVIIKPENLNITHLESYYSLPEIIDFPDECFLNLRAYNKLVLSKGFYLRFSSFQYMLIYQLDAYVFKDELLFWANKGFDYIGAPWVPWKKRYLTLLGRYMLLFQRFWWKLMDKKRLYNEKYFYYQVGNGGFSLRKIQKMIEITDCYRKEIDNQLADDSPFYPEDIFLLLNLTDKRCQLSKPPFVDALKFAMEHNPKWAYEYNNESLPFGCHNWTDKNMFPFWSQIIKYN